MEHSKLVDAVLDGLIEDGALMRDDILERLPAERVDETLAPTALELDRRLGELAEEVATIQDHLAATSESTAATTRPLTRRREVLGPTRRRAREAAAPHRSLVLAHALSADRGTKGGGADLDAGLRLVRSALATDATPADRPHAGLERHVKPPELSTAERPAPSGSDGDYAFEANARRFLELAVAQLARHWTSRLQTLPAAVGDRAYDDALEAIVARARRGVDGFQNERGEVSADRVSAYVKLALNTKTRAAWANRDVPRRSDASVYEVASTDELDVVDRLERDAAADAILERAQGELARLSRRAHSMDARRLEHVAELLEAHGITGTAASVVMARATRRSQFDITTEGLELRYEPPPPFRVIGERVGLSAAGARKAYHRAMQKLPAGSEPLIDKPELHNRLDVIGGREPTHDAR